MSNASRVSLGYIKETSWGVTPSAALNLLRFTNENIKQAATTDVSKEIRSDRQVPGSFRTQVSATGTIGTELSFQTFDDLISGFMMSAWSSPLSLSGSDIAADGSGGQYTSTTTTFSGIVVGQFVNISGFSNSGNNGWHLVTAVSANALTVQETLTTEAAGPTVTISGSVISNGTTLNSFTFEKQQTDLTNVFQSAVGCVINQWKLTVNVGNPITADFDILGKSLNSTTSSVGTGAAVAAPTNDIMETVDNVADVREGGTATTIDISEITIDMNNNAAARQAIGQLGAVGIRLDQAALSGTLHAYFEDATLLEKYLNFTSSSLSFRLEDASGNAYVIYIPKIKYTDGNNDTPNSNSDVMVTLNWQAEYDPTTGKTIMISKS